MDVLSDVLRAAGVTATLVSQTRFSKPWALRFPCAQSIGFHVVTQGECWIRPVVASTSAIALRKGDIALMARGFDHELASDLTEPAVSVADAPMRAQQEQLRETDGTQVPLTTLVCGAYRIARKPLHPLFGELPEVLLLRAEQVAAHHPLHAALGLLSAELSDAKPAADAVVTRLVDILFHYIFRYWAETSCPSSSKAWSLALRDQGLSRALSAMHRNIAKNWTLDDLARESGASRAAFALRFKTVTGETPVKYLTRLRVERSTELLENSDQSLERIAELVGYSNPFAFSKAFKRVRGISPREFRFDGRRLSAAE